MCPILDPSAGHAAWSHDGYIRLTHQKLMELEFQEAMTWEDPNLHFELKCDGIPASSAGYCEWIAPVGNAQASIGWAWFCAGSTKKTGAPNGISSNIMLVDASGYDLGPQMTCEHLGEWISNRGC